MGEEIAHTHLSQTFRDIDGAEFTVGQLTRELAVANTRGIVKLHNQIPFQSWTERDVLAEGDERRAYTDKWTFSTVAFAKSKRLIGFCFGFRVHRDAIYKEPGVYLHRMALAPDMIGRRIGAILLAETARRVFSHIETTSCLEPFWVYGQTNDVPSNSRIIQFYHDAGYQVFDRKPYADRVDLVMRMSKIDCETSRHAQLRDAQRT
ncbi:GNAT family N-acetyltransferase [Bradyrhizobium centrolobii]|uniref:GNAT family N-acetyltransferase n=1 Tax=Bradyrhizobium centrolobii TaxID=1505087 RepID=UPI0009EDBFCA|nr:GNAT family N-acetyltransferase [Bradyrhizobium centrolobii]